MHWLYTTFKTYCATRGINLLRDDLLFIEKRLARIPQEAHKRIAKQFVEKWLEGIGSNENALNSVNLGRRIANIWLREVTDD